jgi:molybdate transport system substrate-binding protein
MTLRILASIVAGLGLVASAGMQAAEPAQPEINLYAAASLRDVLESVTPACERATSTKLVVNLGSSNELARQIEAGRKADVFFCADEAWMNRLEKAGLVEMTTRRSVLSNRLVVIGRRDDSITVKSPADLLVPAIKWIALANPEAVPAGKYAREWLEKAGLWGALGDRVLPSVDVRAALAAVEAGGAQAGVVYRTDARISSKVRVLYEVSESEGPPISYPIAAMKDRPHLDAAIRVVTFLGGPEVAAAYEKFGFIVKTQSH